MREQKDEQKKKRPSKARKNSIYNGVMILILVAIVFSAAMFVGNIRGWFTEGGSILVTGKSGLAHVERKGIAYSLQEGTILKEGDRLKTLDGASVHLEIPGQGEAVLHEDTTLMIQEEKENTLGLQVMNGEVFFHTNTKDNKSLSVFAKEEELSSATGVFSVSVRQGTSTVYVYGGEVIHCRIEEETLLQKGDMLTILKTEKEENLYEKRRLTEETLSDFILRQLQKDYEGKDLFLTKEEAERILGKRQETVSLVLEEQINQETLSKKEEGDKEPGKSPEEEVNETQAGGEKAPSESQEKNPSKEPQDEKKEPGIASGNIEAQPGKTKETEKEKKEEQPTEIVPPVAEPEKPQKPAAKVLKATISIRVDSILDNMKDLTPGKEQYVPQNGVLLKATTVEFTQGETVFDVLKRVAKAANMQLEYAYTPLYKSYYVEGIQHLYEFDVGSESGWMYQVNGWFPNYGSSAYKLKDGDVILWAYTCKGLGADIGGSVL
ncbi:DUF4430 domain-containing protein [Proteiniclasticum ruminis]|uniref:FecR protein n=1 Tax=Proteiniclasticum ruminis TaxID=398199 RepID=A0A1I5C0P6_9CLOT|nr:DUF4430 domain-containing protein [Proteiniclasticum ruminis]SFN80476.1 FecR protein [Proteiniclasticum ruminis]